MVIINNLELLKQSSFGELLVDVYRNEDDEVFMTMEQLARALEYSNRNSVEKIVQRNEHLKERKYSVVEPLKAEDGKFYNTRLLNKNGIKSIVTLSTVPFHIKRPILDFLNVDMVFIKDKSEHKHLKIISDSFIDFNPQREVNIGSYRVDLLLASLNIVVECDEYGHKYYCQKNEEERENYLKDKGFKVVRFNPNQSNFAIGSVIAEILKLI